MPRFDPEAMLRILNEQGARYVLIDGLAATLHGSPLRTGDADICPARDGANLERLAKALARLKPRIRTADAPHGLAFACDAAFFRNVELVNLITDVATWMSASCPRELQGTPISRPEP